MKDKEEHLVAEFTQLHKKFSDALEEMCPQDFLGFIDKIASSGLSLNHYLAVQTRLNYAYWCHGQSHALEEMGLPFDGQVMPPWGKACSQLSFLQDARDAFEAVVRAKECVLDLCPYAPTKLGSSAPLVCSRSHPAAHDAGVEMFYAVSVCIEIKKRCPSGRLGQEMPHLDRIKALARRYMCVLNAYQFSDKKDNTTRDKNVGGGEKEKGGVLQFITCSAVSGCANPTCEETNGWNGGNEPAELKACSRCQKVYYCSRECQVAHWKTHKKIGCK